MALYKYDGPFAEVEVRVAGEYIGIVEKGGQIVVPDELADKASFGADWSKADSGSASAPVSSAPTESPAPEPAPAAPEPAPEPAPAPEPTAAPEPAPATPEGSQ